MKKFTDVDDADRGSFSSEKIFEVDMAGGAGRGYYVCSRLQDPFYLAATDFQAEIVMGYGKKTSTSTAAIRVPHFYVLDTRQILEDSSGGFTHAHSVV